jgi:hypothetical protein
MYVSLVAAVGLEDVGCTRALIALGASAWFAKSLSSAFGLVLNFAGRRFVVFARPLKEAVLGYRESSPNRRERNALF